jgi:hypothetical protein
MRTTAGSTARSSAQASTKPWRGCARLDGEAPDGEEDERDAGAGLVYRITGAGVEALADVE